MSQNHPRRKITTITLPPQARTVTSPIPFERDVWKENLEKGGMSEDWIRIAIIHAFGKVEPDDLPDDPCYRCGYFALSSDWIFALFNSKDPMTPACKLHDQLYEIGPGIGMTRKQADDHFYDAMTIIVEKYSGWKRRLLYVQRNTYYGIVRATGGLYWPDS
jgi:hypothetical protein